MCADLDPRVAAHLVAEAGRCASGTLLSSQGTASRGPAASGLSHLPAGQSRTGLAGQALAITAGEALPGSSWRCVMQYLYYRYCIK